MNLKKQAKQLERMVKDKRILDNKEQNMLQKELETWTTDELKQIVNCPPGKPYPEYLQKRLERIGL